MVEYSDCNKLRVLRQIAMLLRWFDQYTTTTIGDSDYNYLVEKLIKNEVAPFTNKDVFFTKLHGKKNYKIIYIESEDQKLFNQRIQNFMVLNNLCWSFYKSFIKK